MKKILLLSTIAALLPAFTSFAQKEISEIKFKPYGFVRNYAVFDSRACSAGTQDLYFFGPKDIRPGADGQDLNAIPAYRMLALSSRLGLNITGFQYGNMDLSAKFEADFYTMNGSTAIFRLRQAYMKLVWDNLWNRENHKLSLLAGQAWHPMAVDNPYTIALEAGAPYRPFARTPQATLRLELGRNFALTGSLLYQMQYLSTGPKGKSQDYIKHSLVPQFFAGAEFNNGGFTAKLGVDMLNIKPRTIDEASQKKVSDRLMVVSPCAYLKYSTGAFSISAQSVLAESGEHLNFISGYGVSKINEDQSREYTPMRSSVSNLSLKYGKKLQFMTMVGYIKLLGTKDPLYGEDGLTGKEFYYFNSALGSNLNQMYRITPTIAYNWSKLTLALEYNLSSAQYGTYKEEGKVNSSNGLVTEGLHWVTNHRVVLMLKYAF